jgi:SAM-dependent methyltransferase
MGRSDPFVFSAYKNVIPARDYNSAAFLGFSGPNPLTNSIKSDKKDFYDLSLGNWEINEEEWNIAEKYDLIVCTRCPYFSKKPDKFLDKCLEILKPGGFLLADWGLGDHWRFNEYKIGWVKNGEQEFAYKENNFLWSTVWHDSFSQHPEFLKFSENVKKFGYEDVRQAVFKEVPTVLNIEDYLESKSTIIKNFNVALMSLWPELPQLYIVTCLLKA